MATIGTQTTLMRALPQSIFVFYFFCFGPFCHFFNSISTMEYKEIRETIAEIVTKLQDGSPKDEKQRLKSAQEVSSKLLSQLDGDKPIEKLYFGFLLIDFFNRPNLSQKLKTDFIRSIFPSMLNKRQAALVSQVISLALTLRHGPLLDCMEFYVKNCDSISFPSIPIAATLARDSPMFCSAVISRGYFQFNSASKDHLVEWLRLLVDLVPEYTINLNKAIRFSFLDRPTDYELHLVILNLIRHRKCEQLSNHSFIIDLATSISNQLDNKVLIDRFAQMLIIAYANDMCSQSNQLKSTLLNKFPDHNLIKAVCK